MQRCSARDRNQLGKRVIDAQGYLSAPAVIGRCGIQVYTRGELGLDGDPNAMVRLMRTPEEVFRPETIASFENKPICDDHPREGVDATTWKTLTIGGVRDTSRQSGDLLGARAIVMDANGVKTVEGGKDYLSCGYTFDLDLTPGTAPDGTPFDGYQRNILGDHVAIVTSPRGGPVCRIGDEQKGTIMATRKLAVDGLPRYELEETAADVIENHIKKVAADRDQVIADFDKHVDEAKAKIKTAETAAKTATDSVKAKDTEIADLKAKLAKATAIDVDALVATRAALVENAKKLAPELTVKGSDHDIRKAAIAVACTDETNKAVVEQIVGADGIDKATDAQIQTAFGILLALPKQAALAAQDAAMSRALLGAGNSAAAITGPVERL